MPASTASGPRGRLRGGCLQALGLREGRAAWSRRWGLQGTQNVPPCPEEGSDQHLQLRETHRALSRGPSPRPRPPREPAEEGLCLQRLDQPRA